MIELKEIKEIWPTLALACGPLLCLKFHHEGVKEFVEVIILGRLPSASEYRQEVDSTHLPLDACFIITSSLNSLAGFLTNDRPLPHNS